MNLAVAQETFAWKARDIHGRELSGSQVASCEEEVANVLRTQGLFVTSIFPEPLLQGEPDVEKEEILVSIAHQDHDWFDQSADAFDTGFKFFICKIRNAIHDLWESTGLFT